VLLIPAGLFLLIALGEPCADVVQGAIGDAHGGEHLLACLFTFALLAVSATPAAAEMPTPSCAEGPRQDGDVIVGTDCADTIVVPPNVAYVNGGPGNDTILATGPSTSAVACTTPPHCGAGSQEFVGGPGNDTVFGERGNDILRGGEGNDLHVLSFLFLSSGPVKS